jgi:TfoX/Sxy family transcriptional regulator of competence genes
MAYDETLAERVRERLAGRTSIDERRMFGGLALMLDGNMCCCVTEHGLMVRVGPDAYHDALAQPHARVMDLTGRPMRGWVSVEPEGLASDAMLGRWVEQGAEFAGTLPPK